MAQQSIGVRFGKPTTTSISYVVCSLTNDTVTVTINGISANPTMNQLGTDHTPPQAGFYGQSSATGLSPYTKYTYTVTQGSNTVTGYFWTAPEADDDFILIPISCDNNTTYGGDPAGGYTQIKAIAEANPDKGVYILHIDDHLGYLDSHDVNDGGTYALSGATPPANAKVWDYALGAFAAFGLYSASGNNYCTWGQNEDRIWCMQNIPVFCTWGDHDAGDDDMGWEIDPTSAVGSPAPATKFANSQTVYDAFCGPFEGSGIDGVNSRAWATQFGCIKIICPDGISRASGDGSETIIPGTIYHNDQVDNIITACDVDTVPFKLLTMTYGIRYFDDNNHEFNDGDQHAIGGNPTFVGGAPTAADSEYARLFTDASGLMSKTNCNGVHGCLFTVHGDWHAAKVVKNESTAGTNDEWFYSIHVGTINGSINFETSGITVDTSVDGSTPEMADGSNTIGNRNNWWVVPFYVYGSRDMKEIEIDFMDKNGATLWNKKFVAKRGGNDAHAITTDLSLGLSIASNSGIT